LNYLMNYLNVHQRRQYENEVDIDALNLKLSFKKIKCLKY
jgi:hypothetical protein